MRQSVRALVAAIILLCPLLAPGIAGSSHALAAGSPDTFALTAHIFQHGKDTGHTMRISLNAVRLTGHRLSFDVQVGTTRQPYAGVAERGIFPHQVAVVFHIMVPVRGRFAVSFVRIDGTPGTRPGIIRSFPAAAGPLFRIDIFDRTAVRFFVAEVPARTLPPAVAKLLGSILRLRASLPPADPATDNGGMTPIIVGSHHR